MAARGEHGVRRPKQCRALSRIAAMSIERFELIPATPEFLRLLVAGQYHLAERSLNLVVPEGWPNDPEAIAGLAWHLKALESNGSELLWRMRLIVVNSTRTVIGSVNLKGSPDEGGAVEIGWGVSEQFRRRGIATRAAEEVMEWVFSQPGVKRIIATIPLDNTVSQRVAERLGMQQTQETRRELPVWEKKRASKSENV